MLDENVGYKHNEKETHRRNNMRNGKSPKTLKSDQGEVTIDVPRDRISEFEPVIVPKGKTRLEGFEDTILSLYARGMTTREIQAAIKEFYHGAEVSYTVISNVTDAVIDEVTAWRERPLDSLYPIVFLDCIVVKVRRDARIIEKSIYWALGVNESGHKDLMGLWITENEESKFWLSVLTDLETRGVKDIFIAPIQERSATGLVK